VAQATLLDHEVNLGSWAGSVMQHYLDRSSGLRKWDAKLQVSDLKKAKQQRSKIEDQMMLETVNQAARVASRAADSLIRATWRRFLRSVKI
jgi:hypothetical protein